MEFQEFLENLSNENTLLESGPDQNLRHYTNLSGLINILNKEKIQAYAYSDTNNNEVSVIRKSGDIKNIESITDDKNIIGYFEIEFHKLNDKIRRIKKRKTNELWTTYNQRIERLLEKYSINKNDNIFNNPELVKNKLSQNDYKLLLDLIHDANLSLTKKEGEERIIGSIPLNPEYMKFYFIKNIDNISHKAKSTIDFYKSIMPDLFEE